MTGRVKRENREGLSQNDRESKEEETEEGYLGVRVVLDYKFCLL